MKLPRQLSYTRSLSPGKAVFFYKTPESDFEPLQIERQKIRGQKSGFAEAYKNEATPKELAPQDLAFGNPHTIELCYVPPTVQQLYCRFSLRVEANSLEPNVCGEPKVSYWLARFVNTYKQHGGFGELAKRYAKNILMCEWLWRNKTSPNVDLEIIGEGFEPISITKANRLRWDGKWREAEAALQTLTEVIKTGLEDPYNFCFLEVTAKLDTYFGQEIYPSQSFAESVDVARTYAYTQVAGKDAACFHSQKVGAAIQMIDDWYDEDANKRLRIHEYGADYKNVIARRAPSNRLDFYSLLQKVALYVKEMEQNGLKNQEQASHIHYIAAVLIKGGLFQRTKE
ncbi:type I-F CRISPR-associated protein Csy3 [Pseudoalteromonas piscicida]|uniref:type I-F CRISPR-associated protein Csy3 n=1 Tax=Pseudoalteromonas piscicida TaxID=43662 RepID=UPI0032C09FE7